MEILALSGLLVARLGIERDFLAGDSHGQGISQVRSSERSTFYVFLARPQLHRHVSVIELDSQV